MSIFPGISEPYPTRDAIVKPSRKPTDVLVRWEEQSLLQRVNLTPFRVESSNSSSAPASGTVSGTIGGDLSAGVYRVTVNLATRTAEAASQVELTLAWTFGGVTRTRVFVDVLDGSIAAGEQGFVYPVWVDAGTPISYTLTYTGATLTFDYAVSAEFVEAIG